MSVLILFSLFLEVPTNAKIQERDTKDIQIRRKEIKLVLFTEGISVCIENPKEFTKIL